MRDVNMQAIIDTLGDVEPSILVKTLADTVVMVETRTVGDTLGDVKYKRTFKQADEPFKRGKA